MGLTAKPNRPKKHHYITKSFLAEWSHDGSIDGRLWVMDKVVRKPWCSSPANAGYETFLYRIDSASASVALDENEIENAFSKIEGAAIPVIRALAENSEFAGGDLENVCAFIATLVVRTPARMRLIENCIRSPIEVAYQRAKEQGLFPPSADPSVDAKIDEMWAAGTIRIEIKKNFLLGMMVHPIEPLMRSLMGRNWTVLKAARDAGDLICTDMPVLLNWIKPASNGEQPGFGLANTAVFVPIGPSTALLGLWDAAPTSTDLSRDQVTFWNGKLLGRMDRFVYCRSDFAALHKSGAIHRRDDVLKCWSSD